MTYYIIKLIIMLPIMAGMIYGGLWLYKKYQPGLIARLDTSARDLKVVESVSMGVSGKLAVVEFAGQKILLSVTRAQINMIASAGTATSSASAPFPPAALAEPDRDLLSTFKGRGA
ncbi:FliO/MopB family protein [Blastomonas sp.]|uniref:FliO/MopB family protein n=1 Tax=Blastomonas sp. TaxID=1909299 RepID=UPI003593A04D